MNMQTSKDNPRRRRTDVGAGHAVVLLHGLCGSALELGSIRKVLESNGCTVIVPEIPNYSAALIEPAATPDWTAWCEHVEAEIARLKERFESVSLCGLSMGATLALALAARAGGATGKPDLAGLVLLSPVLHYDGWSVPWYHALLGLAYRLGIRNWNYRESEPYGIKNLAMRRRVVQALKKDGVAAVGAAELPAKHLWAAQGLMAYVRATLPRVTTDTLVIHSVDDETASPRGAELILTRIGAATRRVVWLGDCYHIITVDNEREIVVNETVRFLTRAGGSRGTDSAGPTTLQGLPLKDRRYPRAA